MQDFMTLPAGAVTLANAQVLGPNGALAPAALGLDRGRLSEPGQGSQVDLGGRIVLPAFTDMHTHLDKGQIWPRAANPDGTFMGALTTVRADREAHWTAEDVARRMDFALRSAHAHGTARIRTHIDSLPPQDAISWPVFAEMRAEWAGRIDLQGVCLVPIDSVAEDGPFAATADRVAAAGGVLGAVAFGVPDLAERLDTFFAMAAARGLAADFHVDETADPEAAGLRAIAQARLRTGFDAPVVVGHCCSLAQQPEAEAERTLDLVAQAGLSVVSLPMCNLYLQDRHPGRTPRWRGITLVHEMMARGIPVAFASDNTRDPFYAYGDLDMLEVLREAVRIGHLDHARPDFWASVTTTPAAACGFDPAPLVPGAPADLVVFNARNVTELLSRPQSDRIVLRGGRAILRSLPDYSELDDLMETPCQSQATG